MNKKGLSPLIATFMLLIFAIAIGVVVMKWSEKYIGDISIEQPQVESDVSQDPLEILKVRFAKGEISAEEYENMRSTLIS